MTEEMALWHTFRDAVLAHIADPSLENTRARLLAHEAWVRVYDPKAAEALIAHHRKRLGIVDAA